MTMSAYVLVLLICVVQLFSGALNLAPAKVDKTTERGILG